MRALAFTPFTICEMFNLCEVRAFKVELIKNRYSITWCRITSGFTRGRPSLAQCPKQPHLKHLHLLPGRFDAGCCSQEPQRLHFFDGLYQSNSHTYSSESRRCNFLGLSTYLCFVSLLPGLKTNYLKIQWQHATG